MVKFEREKKMFIDWYVCVLGSRGRWGVSALQIANLLGLVDKQISLRMAKEYYRELNCYGLDLLHNIIQEHDGKAFDVSVVNRPIAKLFWALQSPELGENRWQSLNESKTSGNT